MSDKNNRYMHRCIELAERGAGMVGPNPMVGAVLVSDNRIIGEGWHAKYGGAHAEVECINSVMDIDKPLIARSTLYVSLEPCSHFGKTPPCTDLIIEKEIREVVIGCKDPFPEVNGRGIGKLEAAGVSVTTGVLEDACRNINKRFFTYVNKKRPYIILKWAETADGIMGEREFIARKPGSRPERLLISNKLSSRLVHRWRSEEAAILIGTNTASEDDPMLTTRWWPGVSPVRVILDRELKLPGTLKLFSQDSATLIFNLKKQEEAGNLSYRLIKPAAPLLPQLLSELYVRNIQSVLVEGGAQMLQTFIDGNMWDEAIIIRSDKVYTSKGKSPLERVGIKAPVLKNCITGTREKLLTDTITRYFPTQ